MFLVPFSKARVKCKLLERRDDQAGMVWYLLYTCFVMLDIWCVEMIEAHRKGSDDSPLKRVLQPAYALCF